MAASSSFHPPPPREEPAAAAHTPRVEAEREPSRRVVNFFFFSAFDFSEMTQGGTTGLEINFARGEVGTFGVTLGVGALACVLSRCSEVFLHFPTALRGGVKLGSVVEWNFRVGVAPALIFSGGSSAFLAKFLIGTGFVFEVGRGGAFIGIDLLPNSGFAHVINIGWLL